MRYKIEYFIPAENKFKVEEIEANSAEEIIQEILRYRKDIVLLNISKQILSLSSLFSPRAKLSLEELGEFSYFLGKSLEIGINITAALEDYKHEIKSKKMQEVFDSIIADIMNGYTLTQSLQKHPLFPPIMIAMMKTGEETGNIHTALLNYSKYVKWLIQIRSSIKKALTYPLIVSITITIALSVILIYVLPKIIAAFKEMHMKEFPLPTKILMWLAENTHILLYALSGIIFCFVTLFLIKKLHKQANFLIDQYTLRIPIFGKLIFLRHISEDFKTLRDMYISGNSLTDSLRLIATYLENNLFLRKKFQTILTDIERGTSLSEAFKTSALFSPLILRTIAIGEVSGNLNESLDRIIEMYEASIQESIEQMTAMIEPALQIVLGGILGLLAAGMLAPVYEMITNMNPG